MTLYAIGDIHGHIAKLDRALALIEADGGKDAEIVFVGDYIDRGPDSRAVIERLMDGLEAGRPWTCLKGNHDRLMEWFFEPEPRHDPYLPVGYHWFHPRIGGVETLASYGVAVPESVRLSTLQDTARRHVPEAHLSFLRELKLSHEAQGMIFVHAGIRPGVPVSDQTEEDLLWIRQGFLEHPGPHDHLVVHGHTAVDAPEHVGPRINLDGGAAYGRTLVPAAFEAGEVFTLTESGRVPLRPRDNPV